MMINSLGARGSARGFFSVVTVWTRVFRPRLRAACAECFAVSYEKILVGELVCVTKLVRVADV